KSKETKDAEDQDQEVPFETDQAWPSSRAPLLTTGGTSSSDSVSLSVKPSSAYRDDDSS
ncbi:hypothetical protein Tco_0402703, partial [Tanacetum coccineum]